MHSEPILEFQLKLGGIYLIVAVMLSCLQGPAQNLSSTASLASLLSHFPLVKEEGRYQAQRGTIVPHGAAACNQGLLRLRKMLTEPVGQELGPQREARPTKSPGQVYKDD